MRRAPAAGHGISNVSWPPLFRLNSFARGAGNPPPSDGRDGRDGRAASGAPSPDHELHRGLPRGGQAYFSLRQLIEARFSNVLDSISISKPLRSRYFKVST
ncbi:hypothetical protein [Lysobacter gummosus]|uniref:hypothetical protein n=1 Tax=Lysobacter gummosus TaxID=262324 RepID=UPI0036306FE8